MDKNRISFANADDHTRNQVAIQYEPLVNKIVAQQARILKTDWYILKSMAYEGLAMALNQYDPSKSKMSFTQYAAFAILNNIRNRSCEELHTVKLTSYTQDKIRKGDIGGTTFSSVSISTIVSPEDGEVTGNREMRYGIYGNAKFSDGDVLDTLHQELLIHCNRIDVECFMHYYGLCGYAEQSVQEIAKAMAVTSGRISQRIRRVVEFIRGDQSLCELLASLSSK